LGGGDFEPSPFFQKPRIAVINPIKGSRWQRAKIHDELEPQIRIALQLNGRGVGSLTEILDMPTDLVLDAWHFYICQAETSETEQELNKDHKS
jgi:hypothetical protein